MLGVIVFIGHDPLRTIQI